MTLKLKDNQVNSQENFWTFVRVDDVFEIQQGKQVSQKNRQGDNQQYFLRTKNIFWNRLDINDLDRMHFSDSEEIRLKLKRGDLLLCEGGSVGRTAIWNGEIERCYYQNHLHRLRIKNNTFNSEFALYWFWYAFEYSSIYSGRKNITTIPNLSRSRLGELPIPLPPLEEQRKIAKVLSLVQDAIAQQEQLIALTTELKKSLTKKLFTEGTRGEPQKMTEIGIIPESWYVVPLEKTGDVIYGIQASVANNIEPIGTKIITNKNITLDGEFDFEKQSYFEMQTERHRKTILKKGDILFNWRSGSKEHVGKTAYFDIDGEYIHSSFILRIRPYPQVNGRYLFNYLRWLRESGYFIKKQTYAINAKFNKSAVDLLPTLLPPREEQDHVASTLDLISEKINQYRTKSNILQDLFQNLLHQLMTAQIRVDDLDLCALDLEIGEGGE